MAQSYNADDMIAKFKESEDYDYIKQLKTNVDFQEVKQNLQNFFVKQLKDLKCEESSIDDQDSESDVIHKFYNFTLSDSESSKSRTSLANTDSLTLV